jgi:hypothetical protein
MEEYFPIKQQKVPFEQRPFTKESREDALIDIRDPMDHKRTICNVIRLIYNCAHEETGCNVVAIKELSLEAMWMGKRMSSKLSNIRKEEMKGEYIEYKNSSENYNFDMYDLAQGNWD